jgi:hypothetical protein
LWGIYSHKKIQLPSSCSLEVIEFYTSTHYEVFGEFAGLFTSFTKQSLLTAMSASQNQSSLNDARGAGTTLGPDDLNPQSEATPGMSAGSATAAGHGQHPRDNADNSNATMPNTKVGPQNEDLNGEQMRAPGEGDVMDAQFNKSNAGWGEEGSFTSDLDRQNAEQQGAREKVQAARKQGVNVDGGAGSRVENEGISSV